MRIKPCLNVKQGEDGLDIYLKYYASEADRRLYRHHYPDRAIPEHVEPPYHRDHLIPDF